MNNLELNSSLTNKKKGEYTKLLRINLLIIVFTLFLTSKVVYDENIKDIIIFILFFIFNIYLLYFFRNKSSILNILFIMSFFLKALYSIHIYNTIGSPFPDGIMYLSKLNQMNNSTSVIGFNNIYNITNSLHVGYEYFNYIIYNIFESNLSLYLSNILIFQVSCILFNNYLMDRGINKIIINSVIFFSLISMNMLLFTSNILKDSLVLFGNILMLYEYNKYTMNNKKIHLLLATFAFFILLSTRIYTAMAMLIAILVDYCVNNDKIFKIMNKKTLMNLFIVISILVVVNKFLSLDIYTDFIFEELSRFSSNIPKLIIGTVYGTITMFFSPLPWNVIGINDVYSVTGIDSILLIGFSFSLILFAIKFIKYRNMRKITYVYIIPIIIHAAILGTTYTEGSTRQRIPIFLFMILIYILGIFYREPICD